jgi:hypothetical protein
MRQTGLTLRRPCKEIKFSIPEQRARRGCVYVVVIECNLQCARLTGRAIDHCTDVIFCVRNEMTDAWTKRITGSGVPFQSRPFFCLTHTRVARAHGPSTTATATRPLSDD